MSGTPAKETEFRVLSGEAAREIDPDGIAWPDEALVIYALEGDKIVGRQAMMVLPHLEGAWVDEARRGGTLAARLVKKAEELLSASGRSHVFAFSYDQQPVGDYLERFGYSRFPVTTYVKELT